MPNSKLSIHLAYKLLPDLANRCQMKYALISERNLQSNRIIVHKFWCSDHYSNGFEYDWEGAPCEWVFKFGPQCFDQDVQQRFPKDHDLVKLNIHAYVGVPILNDIRVAIGHVALLNDLKIDNCSHVLALLTRFTQQIQL